VLDERVDGFVILKNISDPRYLQDPTSFEAKLLPDFSGVVVKEPSVAPCFIEDLDLMETAEEEYTSGNCDRVFDELRMRLVEYGMDVSRKYRYTVIQFPDGMKGTNLYFNKSATNRKETKLNLDTNPRFINQHFSGKGLEFDYVTTYVYWKVAVDGSQRSTTETNKAGSMDDLVSEAIKGFKRTSLNPKNP
jgi:hypothetical protein